MQRLSGIAAATTVLLFAACDEIDSDLERGAVGAAIGCVAGEVLIDGACIPGAVVGGAGGLVIDDL
ncbi:MAG: hypothetical protein AAF566_05105 [Pseudomonadota bacterium]